jgi:hypothetical protein
MNTCMHLIIDKRLNRLNSNLEFSFCFNLISINEVNKKI